MAYSTAMRKKSAYAKKGGARRSSIKRTAPVTMAAVQRYVRKVAPPPELKALKFQLDEGVLNTLSASMSWTECSTANWGNGPSGRNGNEVIAKGINVIGVARNNSLSTTWLRMLVLGYDAGIDVTDPEVFSPLSSGQPATPLTVTGLNLIYTPIAKPRFTVHADQRFCLGASTTTDGKDTAFFKRYVKLNKKITFDANTSGQNNQNYRYAIVFFCATADDDSIGTTMDLSYQGEWTYVDP